MGLQIYLDVSILLLVFTACITTNASPTGGGPCPLPSPKKAATLGNLTAILAARLKGPPNGYRGDSGASSRICLAVFQADWSATESVRINGDYNVFYHVVASTSKPGAPTSAFVALGKAGKLGTTLFEIAGAKATWTDITVPPNPPISKDKLITPTYTYVSKGKLLRSSMLRTASDGKTVKDLLDAMRSSTKGYYGGFATAVFKKGAASGKFNNDPLPLALVGVVATKLAVKEVHSKSSGDMYGTGCVSIAVFLNTTTNDYDIRYRVSVNTSDPNGPTEVLLAQGYNVPLTLVNRSATWTNLTAPDANVAGGYMYEINGTIPATYKQLMNGMLAAPRDYSDVLLPNYFDLGALRGWFVNSTLAGGSRCAIA